MPTIEITKIQTMSQKSFIAATTHFTVSDALALEVFVRASQDLVALPRVMVQVVFSILDAPTVFTRAVLSPLLHGSEF